MQLKFVKEVQKHIFICWEGAFCLQSKFFLEKVHKQFFVGAFSFVVFLAVQKKVEGLPKTNLWGGEGGRTNERPETDPVTSWPMRGLQENCTRLCKHQVILKHEHGDSITEFAQSGRFSEN